MCTAAGPLLPASVAPFAFGSPDPSGWIILGMVAGSLVLLVVAGCVIIRVTVRQENKRTEALRQVAEELKFDFTYDDDGGLGNDLAGRNFYLFSHGPVIYRVLRGRASGVAVAIFDYNYRTGSARTDHIYRQTVVAFRLDGPPLPAFSLRPETGLWRKIEHLFGYQEINIAEHPAFSSRYQLRGPNEAAIREVFTGEVLAFYEGLEGVTTEADGDRLLFYRHGNLVDPERIRPFLDEALMVLALFRPPGEMDEATS
jgi:hypothetical protein